MYLVARLWYRGHMGRCAGSCSQLAARLDTSITARYQRPVSMLARVSAVMYVNYRVGVAVHLSQLAFSFLSWKRCERKRCTFVLMIFGLRMDRRLETINRTNCHEWLCDTWKSWSKLFLYIDFFLFYFPLKQLFSIFSARSCRFFV